MSPVSDTVFTVVVLVLPHASVDMVIGDVSKPITRFIGQKSLAEVVTFRRVLQKLSGRVSPD